MTSTTSAEQSSDAGPQFGRSIHAQRAFFAISLLLFIASAALTIIWCRSMATMGMPMPGGWTMSMAWMRMPGQTWLAATGSFLGMWIVMMVAMMLPSLVSMLWRYRQAVAGSGEWSRLGRLTAIVSIGYFFVWSLFGLAAFPVGIGLAMIEMREPQVARAVPLAVGVIVVMAGIVQLTAWKTRHLSCCREIPGSGRTLAADYGTAWRHGLRLGLHCSRCCAGLMAILLVAGVMDLRAMAIVAAAITIERLAPAGETFARVIGGLIVASGLFLIAQAAWLG